MDKTGSYNQRKIQSRVANWFFLFLTILLSVSLIRSFISYQEQTALIEETEAKHKKAADEQEKLKRDLAKVQSNQFIEKEVRNKLSLGREGEIILLLPSISPVITPSPTPIDTTPNWQKWVRLFMY